MLIHSALLVDKEGDTVIRKVGIDIEFVAAQIGDDDRNVTVTVSTHLYQFADLSRHELTLRPRVGRANAVDTILGRTPPDIGLENGPLDVRQGRACGETPCRLENACLSGLQLQFPQNPAQLSIGRPGRRKQIQGPLCSGGTGERHPPRIQAECQHRLLCDRQHLAQ